MCSAIIGTITRVILKQIITSKDSHFFLTKSIHTCTGQRTCTLSRYDVSELAKQLLELGQGAHRSYQLCLTITCTCGFMCD